MGEQQRTEKEKLETMVGQAEGSVQEWRHAVATPSGFSPTKAGTSTKTSEGGRGDSVSG
eukprot:COSAG05_NODE_11789_length_496_cov_0.906801_2_plen_58_part_01